MNHSKNDYFKTKDISKIITNDKNLTLTEKRPLLCPKYDVVFQSLFSNKYKVLTGYFLSAALNRNLSVLEVHTEFSAMRDYPEEKVGRLDLLARLDNDSLVHIELQLVNQHNTFHRLFYSSSKIVSKQLVRGNNYSIIKKTISIALTNFTPDELKSSPDFHSVFTLYDENSGKSLTNLAEYHIINLALAEEEYRLNPSNLLAQWALFISDPNRKEILSIMNDNKDIKEAIDTLEILSDNDILRERAEILERWELEEKWNEASTFNYGKEQGISQERINIAKSMLKKSIDIDTISEVTGLSKNEILKLKD